MRGPIASSLCSVFCVSVASGKYGWRVDPEYARNITVFHVNSFDDGIVPIDMDTSNLAGEIYFDLRTVVLPIECDSPNAWVGDCDNEEIVGADTVISKLTLEVDSRFGEYGRCNFCGNGTDPFSGLPCPAGEYFCTCGDYQNPYQCNETAVGEQKLAQAFTDYGNCTWDLFMVTPWRCWSLNVGRKTGGEWYSTLGNGLCPGENCTWSVVSVDKVVSKNCSDDRIFSVVEATDQYGCFDSCQAAHHPEHKQGKRNTSSPCWIGCFYQTILGPKAMLPTPLPGFLDEGMPLEDLVAAWAAPFNSENPKDGGCPAHPVTQQPVDQVAAALSLLRKSKTKRL